MIEVITPPPSEWADFLDARKDPKGIYEFRAALINIKHTSELYMGWGQKLDWRGSYVGWREVWS